MAKARRMNSVEKPVCSQTLVDGLVSIGGRNMTLDEIDSQMSVIERKTHNHLTHDERVALLLEYTALKAKSRRCGVEELARRWNVERHYPARLMRTFVSQKAPGVTPSLSRKKGQGRPHIITGETEELLLDTARTEAWEFTFREMGEVLGVAPATVLRYLRRNKWRYVAKKLRPALEPKHLEARKAWCEENRRNTFEAWIDIDEKWFYTVSTGTKLKVPPGTRPPRKSIKHKKHITKVMCLVAVARPCAQHRFGGIVGVWRVGDMEVAKRSSKNRAAGTPEFKDKTMDGDRYADMMIKKVIPAARSRMPWCDTIVIQADNAPGHASQSSNNRIKRYLGKSNKPNVPNVRLNFQPAQSPDLNVLDLAVFPSLSKRVGKVQKSAGVYDKEQLWKNVHTQVFSYSSDLLTRAFDTKQKVIKQVLACEGGNDYELPHSKK